MFRLLTRERERALDTAARTVSSCPLIVDPPTDGELVFVSPAVWLCLGDDEDAGTVVGVRLVLNRRPLRRTVAGLFGCGGGLSVVSVGGGGVRCGLGVGLAAPSLPIVSLPSLSDPHPPLVLLVLFWSSSLQVFVTVGLRRPAGGGLEGLLAREGHLKGVFFSKDSNAECLNSNNSWLKCTKIR